MSEWKIGPAMTLQPVGNEVQMHAVPGMEISLSFDCDFSPGEGFAALQEKVAESGPHVRIVLKDGRVYKGTLVSFDEATGNVECTLLEVKEDGEK